MDDLSLAADLVREAGSLAQQMLADGLTTHYKSSISDVVSAADHAAEELIESRLAEHRSADGLVGEEGARRPVDAGAAGRTWYVDPVDGTYNFLSGVPYWCSAVGLVDEQGPVAGAVYYPARDELWVGGRDRPTTLNGEPLPPLQDRPLGEVSVATYYNPRNLGRAEQLTAWKSAVGGAAAVRMLGSASMDLAGVAAGRLGVFLQANLNPWDWFPGAALVLASGGVAEFVHQGDIRWQVAGNAQAVADLRTALLSGG